MLAGCFRGTSLCYTDIPRKSVIWDLSMVHGCSLKRNQRTENIWRDRTMMVERYIKEYANACKKEIKGDTEMKDSVKDHAI